MDHFHGTGDAGKVGRIGGNQLAGGERQQRAHALAALQRAVAHRLVQLLRRALFVRQCRFQCVFDVLLGGGHPADKVFIAHG
ncbi:hypothetical protein D3C85_1777710 [compost metagenome]